jgi:uncharacterized protein (TIGR02145 family)
MRIKMTKLMLLVSAMVLCTVFLFQGTLNAQTKGIFVDKRDGHTYKWMKTGGLDWMIENLRFATNEGSWLYNKDTANAKTFGRLYDWNTASKACPKGWHLPTDLEWTALVKALGGEDVAGEKLQEMDTVKIAQDPRSAVVSQAFSTLIGGVRHSDGTFDGIGIWGGCWSGTFAPTTPDEASNWLFVKGGKKVAKSSSTKTTGYTVRCVKK